MRLHQWVSRLASLITALLACLILCGWGLGSKSLINILPSAVPMHPNTAAAFVLAAAALWLGSGKYSLAKRNASLICAGIIVLFAAARLGIYLLGGGTAIDEWLFPQTLQRLSAEFAPVRIQTAPNTAISLLLVGTCLLLIHSPWRRLTFYAGSMLSLSCALLAMLTICGCLINVAGLGSVMRNIPMSIATATLFLILCSGIFAALLDNSTKTNTREDDALAEAGAMRRSLQNKVFLGFATAICMLIGIGIVSYRSIDQFLNDARWTSHTYQVIAAINGLYADLRDAEAAERGYIITGDPAYLPMQHAASQDINPTFQSIKSLTADNPIQEMRIMLAQPLIAEKLDYLQSLSEVRRQSGFDAAREMLSRGRGVQLMNQTRVIFDQMLDEENQLLIIRSQGTETNAFRGVVLISCGAALALILVIAAGWIINRDINGRARTEAALRASETMFRGLLESAPDAMVIVNDRGTIELVNVQTEKLFGYSADDLLGQSIEMLVPQRYRDGHFTGPILRGVNAGQDFNGLRKDGSEFPAEITCSPMRTQQGLRVSSAIRDISERIRAEEELRNFFAFSNDLMCIAGIDGHFKRLNPAWEKTFGFSEQELCGSPYLDFVHPEDRAATIAEAAKLADGNVTVQFENRYRCKDGSYRWLMWSSTLSADKQRIYAGARDVTERKHQEQVLKKLNDALQVRQTELEAANKELESFSYSVSHDLRAPLRAIDGFSQALLEDNSDKLGEDGTDSLNRVRAATQRMGKLIDDMLNLSRVSRSEMRREQVDLSALAKTIAVELQMSEPDRKVQFVIADGLSCRGDAALLRATLENLLGNAWKFTSKRESASIEFGYTDQPRPAYFVRDNGAGFDMSYSQKLFGAFQRLHKASDFPGTGIGLATVQRIIHRHGGQVWAESAIDQGAAFYFTLNPEHPAQKRAA